VFGIGDARPRRWNAVRSSGPPARPSIATRLCSGTSSHATSLAATMASAEVLRRRALGRSTQLNAEPMPPFPFRTTIIVAAAGAALIALAILVGRGEGGRGVLVEARPAPPGVDEIHVDIGGEVVMPGVFTLPPGAANRAPCSTSTPRPARSSRHSPASDLRAPPRSSMHARSAPSPQATSSEHATSCRTASTSRFGT
jgi:hypothetical protein